jgi:hypothetical protein
MISGVCEKDAEHLHNPVLKKVLSFYNPEEEFVVCFSVVSEDEVKTWYITAIINKNTKKIAICDLNDDNISLVPSLNQQFCEMLEHDKSKRELIEENDKKMAELHDKIYEKIPGYFQYLKNLNGNNQNYCFSRLYLFKLFSYIYFSM